MRDVRDTFLALSYILLNEPPSNQALCVLVDSRLSYARLLGELERFRAVIHPSIAERIHFSIDRSDAERKNVVFDGSMHEAPGEFYTWLTERISSERLLGHQPSLAPRQLVVAALARLRIRNEPPVTVKHLQALCQVSYPTVATVLKELTERGWIEDGGERGVRLRPLTTGEWMELARDHAKLRKVRLFTDPTGQVTPDQLVKRLARLQQANKLPDSVRIGGVLGASRHFPALDITDAPRLDLSAEVDPAQVAAMLDAGLRPKSKPEQRVVLAVHISRDPGVVGDPGSDRSASWAAELECLADLVELGLTREATEMAHHMESTSKQGRSSA